MLKNTITNLKGQRKPLVYFACILILEIILENTIQRFFNENTIQISVSFIFIINFILYVFLKNKNLYAILQLLIITTYAAILVPHMYFFNFFSFYARLNYILYEPLKFTSYILIIILSSVIIYYYSLLQIRLINKINKKQSTIFYFSFLIILKIILSPNINTIYFENYFQKITATIINQNKLAYYIEDFKVFKSGGKEIKSYVCPENNNISPTIKFIYNTKTNKEFLLIIESWGKLKIESDQEKLNAYFRTFFNKKRYLAEKFEIYFGETCFNGNTSAAEGRELLNMNDEESYRAFLNKGIKPKFNIVEFKNRNKYYTVSAFSGSKEYGSNWGNSEGFRRKIGFKSTFYYEDLNSSNSVNHENNYRAIFDEVMIDSLYSESTKHEKIFAYGLTINTHIPFKLDKTKIEALDYYQFKEKFNGKESTIDQLYRITKIIEHTLLKLATTSKSFEKILIIGDHASPEFSSSFYNKEKVPFMLIKKKSI